MGKSEKQEYYPGHEYQGLFDLMHEQHGLTLLVSEMQEIVEEVRKMDSQSATIEQPLTLQGAMEIHRNQKLVEGDWFQGTEEDYRKVFNIENNSFLGDLGKEWIRQAVEHENGIVFNRTLLIGFPATGIIKKTQLTPEEFLRRAENTFKK